MFLNAIMLAGVAVVVLPLVLHLIGRARTRRVEWGAMLFLHETQARQRTRRLWLSAGLMAMRMLVIAALAVALARPVFGPVTPATGAIPRRVLVLVVDASLSTSYVELGGARLEHVRETALRALGRLSRGDQAGLVTLGHDPATDVAPTTDLQEIASRLAALAPGLHRADLADGVRRADTLLAAAGQPGGSVLCVADRQASTWLPLATLLPADGRTPRIRAVAVGGSGNENTRIESFRQITLPAIVGQPIDVRITVRNDAPFARSAVPLRLRAGGQTRDLVSIDLPPHGQTTVQRTIRLPRPGSTILTAELQPAGIPADDTRDLAIDVLPPVFVRMITAADLPTWPSADTAEVLRAVLTPHAALRQKGDDAFRVNIVSQQQWPVFEPNWRGVLVLAGVGPLTPAQRQAVEQFVYRGGGLLIVPGAETTPSIWNNNFVAIGQALAPAQAIRSAPVVGPVSLAAPPKGQPIPDLLVDSAVSFVGLRVMRQLELAPLRGASIVVPLVDRTPWMVQGTFGRGRVVAVATSLGIDAGDLVRSPGFAPAVRAVIRYLAAATQAPRNLPAGTAIEHTFDLPRDRQAYVGRPDGRTDRVPMALGDDAGMVIYTATGLPGRYTLRTPGQSPVDFMIESDAHESDLRPLNDAALDDLLKNTAVRRVSADTLPEARPISSRGFDGFLPALAIVMIALAAELFLAGRAREGA